MNIEKRSYVVSVKGTKNYQSVSLSEGFEVLVDEQFDVFAFEEEKQKLKDRLVVETKSLLNTFVEERKFDDEIDV
jgi:hypothetical protein